MGTAMWTLANIPTLAVYPNFTQVASSYCNIQGNATYAPIRLIGTIQLQATGGTATGSAQFNEVEVRSVIDGIVGPSQKVFLGGTGVYQNVALQQVIQASAPGSHTAWIEYRKYSGTHQQWVSGNTTLESNEGAVNNVGGTGPQGAVGPQGATGPFIGSFIGSGAYVLGQGVPMVEVAQLSSRNYVGLAVRTGLSEIHVPTGTGDGVLFLGNATAVAQRQGTAGVIIWAQGSASSAWVMGGAGTLTTWGPAHRPERDDRPRAIPAGMSHHWRRGDE